jgi:hypothetical protein
MHRSRRLRWFKVGAAVAVASAAVATTAVYSSSEIDPLLLDRLESLTELLVPMFIAGSAALLRLVNVAAGLASSLIFRLLIPLFLIGLVALLIVCAPTCFAVGTDVRDGLVLLQQESCPNCSGRVVQVGKEGDQTVFKCTCCGQTFCICMHGMLCEVARPQPWSLGEQFHKWSIDCGL